jgi:hypothetical protein
MDPRDASRVSGALYDFMGYLTSKKPSIKVGADSGVYDLMNLWTAFAKERGLDIDQNAPDPDVKHWNESVAEQLISYALGEFYSVGVMPMNDPSQVGYSGGTPGAADTTNFTRRSRWLDNREEGGISNDGSGSERDVNVMTAGEDDADEDFGLAGLPGGSRNDTEAPDSFDEVPPVRAW